MVFKAISVCVFIPESYCTTYCDVTSRTSLFQVRANSLQDLIYKSGQAGVTKASVTIVFDNSDPGKSPINYEQHKEITVTRQVRPILNTYINSYMCFPVLTYLIRTFIK